MEKQLLQGRSFQINSIENLQDKNSNNLVFARGKQDIYETSLVVRNQGIHTKQNKEGFYNETKHKVFGRLRPFTLKSVISIQNQRGQGRIIKETNQYLTVATEVLLIGQLVFHNKLSLESKRLNLIFLKPILSLFPILGLDIIEFLVQFSSL